MIGRFGSPPPGRLMNRSSGRKHRPDYWILLIPIFLLLVGLVVIYAISPALAVQKNVSQNYFISKQVIAILLGMVTFWICSRVPLRIWRKAAIILMIVAALVSVLVRIAGEEINGAYRWIQFGGLSFQAVELIKFALMIWLAGFLLQRLQQNRLDDWHFTFQPLIIVISIVGVVVAVLQSDLGSMGVIISMILAMSFVAGLPLKRAVAFGLIIIVGLVLAISISPYRRQRLNTFINPQSDCQNAGYQSCQSLIAVGSGGLFGKGIAHGAQAYGYVPEAANDSIFAIMAEKFGFLGMAVIILAFGFLFNRIRQIIEMTADTYSRLLATGVLVWLSVQTIINIGAMIGLLPLKGITLPFISYGGTSIIFTTAALGIIFQMSHYTSYSLHLTSERGSKSDNLTQRRRDGRAYNAYLSRRP